MTDCPTPARRSRDYADIGRLHRTQRQPRARRVLPRHVLLLLPLQDQLLHRADRHRGRLRRTSSLPYHRSLLCILTCVRDLQIYRLWIVWSGDKRVVVPGLICLLADTGEPLTEQHSGHSGAQASSQPGLSPSPLLPRAIVKTQKN